MRKITFSEADVQANAHERYHHPDPRVQRQMEILWAKHLGFTHEGIARAAGVSRSTVQRCLTAYVQGGLERIREVPTKLENSRSSPPTKPRKNKEHRRYW